jgi:hypothetical protein
MRYTILLALFPILFITSCAQYQYLEYGAKELVQKDVFLFENDSIQVTYDFRGLNTPFRLNVVNKTEQPIFIDWSKSGIVYNSQTVSFYVNQSEVHLETSSPMPFETGWDVFAITRGTIKHSNSKAMLLPKSVMRSEPFFNLRSRPIDLQETPPTSQEEQRFGKKNKLTTRYFFTEELSPMRFQCYITISFGIEEKVIKGFYHGFFLQSMVKTKENPNLHPMETLSFIQVY